MESANFHHHQEEDHEVVYAFPFPTPSCYGLPWSQNPILMSRNNSSNTMVQDLGFPIESFMTHELQHLGRTTDEFLASGSYPKFLELLNYCSPTSSIEDLHFHPYSSNMKNDHRQQLIYSNTNQDFLLSNFWNDQCQMKGGQYIQNCSDETFSQIFPTINISSLNQSSPSASSSSSSSSSAISSSSSDMNCLPASDIFVSPNFDGSFGHPSSLNPHNLLNMHQPTSHRPSVCPSKMPSVSTTASTYESSKRPATKFIDAKSTQSVVPKKSKMEPRPSSAPFQVRKEKLGDRIAAIQQLVAPFGKTDTASVLMEAIGYIKFLQTQLETLSVPYMKSTDKNGGISSQGGQIEAKRDLRSRGLCLVPLSYLSYVTDGGEAICRPVP